MKRWNWIRIISDLIGKIWFEGDKVVKTAGGGRERRGGGGGAAGGGEERWSEIEDRKEKIYKREEEAEGRSGVTC